MKKIDKSGILTEVSITYSTKTNAKDRPKISSSEDAIKIFREIWADGTIELHESMYVLLMNRANELIGWHKHSSGGMCGTVSDPRLIFVIALKCVAVSIIISHNHPSGNIQPSASDIQLTKNLVEAGKLLEISVLDHIILTKDSYYSFANEGLM